ncbi:MAG: hypothetical protein CL681_15160 [Blastopirellula sp.]|nr:hypothetical protein [Blastopirellula sp.]
MTRATPATRFSQRYVCIGLFGYTPSRKDFDDHLQEFPKGLPTVLSAAKRRAEFNALHARI